MKLDYVLNERKNTLKSYWKFKNVSELQRLFRREQIPLSKLKPLELEIFEADVCVQNVDKAPLCKTPASNNIVNEECLVDLFSKRLTIQAFSKANISHIL